MLHGSHQRFKLDLSLYQFKVFSITKIEKMKTPKGLLIYPPNQLMDVETPRPDGSLNLLYLAAALEAKGVQTDILDCSVGTAEQTLEDTFYRRIRQENGLIRIGMQFDEIAEYVKKRGYDFIGINSNFTPQTKMAFETARVIKEMNPTIKIYTGGVNARALKERFLQTGYFDAICLTEGELIFPRLALGEDRRNIAGIAYVENGVIITNPVDSACFPKELDDLPMPAWDKLPMEKYEQIASPHGVMAVEKAKARYAPLMTSRGCVFRCMYCHISTEKQNIGILRLHSIPRVTAEIDKLISLGVQRIFFEDDTLLAIKPRVKELFRLVKDRHLSIMNVNGVNLINFFDPQKENSEGKWEIDIDFIRLLKDAGFEQLVFPAESGCQRILQKYATNKVNLQKMDLPLLMKTMTQMGIKAPVNMMIGFPDETEEEMGESIALAHKLMEAGAPYVTFFIPIPFPGSKLYEMALEGGYLERDFDPDIMNWKRAVMKNTTVPPEKLEKIRDEANISVNTPKHIENRLKASAGYGLA